MKKVTTTTTTTVVEETVITAPQTTRLICVVDRSGSMSNITQETIGGFNAFVEGQKKEEGEASLSLVIFDNEIDVIHDQLQLQSVPVLDDKVYIPRGYTSLFDAIGVTITKYLATSKPNEKTILAILTDGEENSSKEYTGAQVADLIKKVEDEHKWEVLFLGANIDVSQVASSLNIQRNKFAAFASTGKGIADTYTAINAITSMYRKATLSGASTADINLQAAVTKASQ